MAPGATATAEQPLKADTALNSAAGDTAMNGKALVTSILLLAGLVCSASPAFSQTSPPTSETAKQTEALVDKAAALIGSKGKVAFSEFRVKGSEWFHDDTYLFVYDLKENVLLNPLKSHPSNPSIIRWNKSFSAPRGLRSRAARAGDSVSELSAEIAVETAMVSANWRKNVPVMPAINAVGTKTEQSTRAIATNAPPTSVIALRAASRGLKPSSM